MHALQCQGRVLGKARSCHVSYFARYKRMYLINTPEYILCRLQLPQLPPSAGVDDHNPRPDPRHGLVPLKTRL